jgi:hypothetical protein
MALGRLRAHWWETELRESALIEIARLGGSDELGEAAAHELDDADRRLLTIAHHGADVLRGYAVPLVPAPYLMTMAARDVSLVGIGTDAHGFRRTIDDGAPLDREQWLSSTAHRVLVVGNSTSWGVGVRSDGAHTASALNARDGEFCAFNASVKGSNLVQQRLMVDAWLPEGGTAVVIGGVLDLIFALSWPRDDAHGALPFWNAGDGDLTRDSEWAFEPSHWPDDAAAHVMAHELHALGTLARARNAHVLYVLQPHLDFLDRDPLPDEARLAEAFTQELGAFRPLHASGVLRAHAASFTSWLSRACAAAGVQFLDANMADEMREPGVWFLDHIHLTDAGHGQLAALVERWLCEADTVQPPRERKSPAM